MPHLGHLAQSVDLAEDREQFEAVLRKLQIRQPANGIARGEDEARAIAERIGYPVVVRPSYVLGGRAMEVVFGADELDRYMREAVQVDPDQPVLIDQYLENATEVDVDALCDERGQVVIGGLMEHIEPARFTWRFSLLFALGEPQARCPGHDPAMERRLSAFIAGAGLDQPAIRGLPGRGVHH